MTCNTRIHNILNSMGHRIAQLESLFEQMHSMFTTSDTKDAYDVALRFAEESEKLTLLARALPEYTGRPSAPLDVEKLVEASIPIEVGFTKHGWFCVRIPLLLPKKESKERNYVRENLLYALRRFWLGKPIFRYGKSVLIYRHIYDKARPGRQWRDHDNVEINMTSDLVAFYTLPDDTPTFCNHYYCSAATEHERTEIYVVPIEDFPLWLLMEKDIPDEGEKLYEDLQ